jgi:hypothetical protein
LILSTLVGLWAVPLSIFGPVALAANPVSYSINPSTRAVQPNSNLDIIVTIKTDVALAGASLHLGFNNGSYVATETFNPSVFSFVDYHTDQNDLLFICNNNNCPPGTYNVATITVKSAQSGSMTVSFNPKETADQQLNIIAADGTSGSYSINSSAPASTSRNNSQSTFTVPQDDGNGGTVPVQITDK